jgi:hypothetical protein
MSDSATTAWHLAQFNVGWLKAPIDHPDTAGFTDALDEINALAEAAPGFVWRLQDESGNATAIESPGDPDRIVNLSVWESVETLRNYAYRSEHVDFLRRRLEWFHPREVAHLVMWWVPAGHIPTLAEADERLAHVAEHGPGSRAFTFTAEFPPPDRPDPSV